MESPQPSRPLPTPTKHKGSSRGSKIIIGVLAVVIVIIIFAMIDKPSSNTGTPVSRTSNTTSPPAQSAKSSTQPQKLTADQKQQVSADLNNGLTHYVDTWHQGEQLLGTTQYADANAGLTAMDDPNSAAAKFSAWRQSSNIERDVTTYQNAFKSADDFYTAANEPQAISNYRDDLGTLQTDISTWISDAVGWQIQTTSNATMTKDVQTINNDINQVKSDIKATLAAD